MQIAVTGANGRVGRAVVALAHEEGHTVVPIDRAVGDSEGGGVRHIDLADYPAVVEAFRGCDAVIHLAAISGPGVLPDHVVHANNVVSSYNALEAAAEAGISRVCQASSINAIGGRFSTRPRYDYFPLDEEHPAYPEDPYSLSKWICEQQADAVARRHDGMSVASLRLHGVVPDRAATAGWVDMPGDVVVRHLWGYTASRAAARAFLLGAGADLGGHEVFFVVAPDSMVETPSLDLAAQHYAGVPIRGDLSGTRSFFDCAKAGEMLGWSHDAG